MKRHREADSLAGPEAEAVGCDCVLGRCDSLDLDLDRANASATTDDVAAVAMSLVGCDLASVPDRAAGCRCARCRHTNAEAEASAVASLCEANRGGVTVHAIRGRQSCYSNRGAQAMKERNCRSRRAVDCARESRRGRAAVSVLAEVSDHASHQTAALVVVDRDHMSCRHAQTDRRHVHRHAAVRNCLCRAMTNPAHSHRQKFKFWSEHSWSPVKG